MANEPKELLIDLISRWNEPELCEALKAALQAHRAYLEDQRESLEREIDRTEGQLRELLGDRETPAADARPRVAEAVRHALREAGRPLSLDRIVRAVSKTTGRPLTGHLRVHVANLLTREQAVKQLSSGLYALLG